MKAPLRFVFSRAWLTSIALVACAPSGTSPSHDDAAKVPRSQQGEPTTASISTVRVMTDRGPVIGHVDGALTTFLGIPYAEPPVGAFRWRAPRNHAAWTTPLDAASFGPACPQGADLSGDAPAWDEDCLTLNVWTPSTAPPASVPVMVYVHGGAFRNGASSKPLYDGRHLASAGNVVVVSMNYRLGALGFFAHPALTAEDEHGSSGNYGLLDQQAALRWVQANIAAFGGDPAKVTLFGESAGSMSVCTHLVSPLSAGLFRRAIGQSGSCLYFKTPLHTTAGTTTPSAESRGLAFAQALGCDTSADVLACMRAKPASTIIDTPTDPEGDLGFAAAMPQPNIDGYALVEAPATAFAAGHLNAIDAFIGGTNEDEATLFTRSKSIRTKMEFEQAVSAITPAHVDDVVALYPPRGGSYLTPKAAYNAFITDLTFTCPTRSQTRALAGHAVHTYRYLFRKVTPLGRLARLGAFHGSELPFVFGNLTEASGTDAAERTLSNTMIQYWTHFAASGNPNENAASTWPERTTGADVSLDIDDMIQLATGYRAAECDAMANWSAAH